MVLALGCERYAELALASRTPQEYDHHPCDAECKLTPEILFHQRQGHIDASSHARRGIAVSVLHINGIWIHCNPRIVLRKLTAPVPMRCGTATFQQPGLCKNQCTSTNRSEPARTRTLPPQPVHEGRLIAHLIRTVSACNQHRVEGIRNLMVCPGGQYRHPEVRLHQLLLAGGNNLHRIDGITATHPVGIPEDFNWTDYIKRPHRRNRSNKNSDRLSRRQSERNRRRARSSSFRLILLHRSVAPRSYDTVSAVNAAYRAT